MQFQEEHAWIVQHSRELEKHRGKWIAIYKNKLAASDENLKNVRKKTRNIRALFFLVPRKGEENYVLWIQF